MILGATRVGATAAPASGTEETRSDSLAVVRRAGECSFQISGDGTRGPYRLACPFPSPKSLRVVRDGRRLTAGVGYFLDLESNTLTLSRRLPVGEEVTVSYLAFPFHLPAELFLVNPDSLPPAQAGGGMMAGPALRLSPEIPSTLFITGSKSVGIQVGHDGEPAVEQSLRVTLFGTISEGIEVNGVLSDQSVPFQPEGTTTELDEIDKVYVEVRSDDFRARLGDQVLRQNEGEWARFERKASGARGEMWHWGGGVDLAGLVTKGRFATQRIIGQEGNQGPYLLQREGEAHILILAGSERVWIDGVAMVRGADRDYVIDYETGEVTFTARRLITSEQEIIVDYEYSTDQYRRTISMGRLYAGEQERVRASVLFFREGDDPGDPLFGSLDDLDRGILQAAGGDAAAARRDGATQVDPGEGDYVLVEQADGSLAYTYAPGAGDYRVVFSRVGSGAGSYRREIPYDGPIYFTYVGPRSGDYDPVVLLPLPERLEVADFRLTAALGGAPLSLAAEAALTRADANLLSTLDQREPRAAAALSLTLRPLALTPGRWDWGTLSGRAAWKEQQSGFQPPGRELEVRTIEGWGSDNSLQTVARDRLDLELRHDLRRWLRWSGVGGYRGDDAVAMRRMQFRIDGGLPESGPAGWLRVNDVRRDRDGAPMFRFREWEGESRWNATGYSPWIGAEREERTDSLQVVTGFDDLRTGIEAAPTDALEIKASERWRWEYRRAAGRRESLGRSFTSTLAARFATRSGLSLQADASHRWRRTAATREESDVVALESSYLGRERVFALTSAYRFSGGEEELAVERYVPAVGDSLPPLYSYDPERGVYYYDPEGGSFARVTERTGQREGVLEAATEWDLRIHPERRAAAGGLSRLVAFEGNLRVEERSRSGERWDLALLRPALLQVPGLTLRGVVDGRADLLLRPAAETWNLRLRLAESRSLDDPGGNSPRKRATSRRSLRLRTQFARLYVTEIEGGWENESDRSAALGVDRVSRGLFLTTDWTRAPGARLEAFLQSEMHRDLQVERGIEAELRSARITPGVRWNLPERGRAVLDAGAEWLDTVRGEVPISARGGREIGTTWRFHALIDYRLTDIVTASGDFTSTVEPQSGIRNRGSLRVSAFF